MYEGRDDKKDGAFNIFYMGVNAGAFLGIMLCGWVGEKVGWSFGFGLAGIFMLLGELSSTTNTLISRTPLTKAFMKHLAFPPCGTRLILL